MANDARELIGGHATSTLQEHEQRRLYEAALEDQALFDELVDEEALREALEDGPTRASLLDVLREEPTPAWWRAFNLRMALTAAAVVMTAALGVIVYRELQREPSVDVARAPAPSAGEAPHESDAPVPPRESTSAPVPEQTLAAWLPAATVSPDSDSAFRPAAGASGPMTKSPTGSTASEFVADRAGAVAMFRVDRAKAVRLTPWTQVEEGEAVAVPDVAEGDDVRVVIVNSDVDTNRDADVIAAIEAGRGRIYAPRRENNEPR